MQGGATPNAARISRSTRPTKSACATARRGHSREARRAARRGEARAASSREHLPPRVRQPGERAGKVRLPRRAAFRKDDAEEDVRAVEERDGGRDDQRTQRLPEQSLSDQETEVAEHQSARADVRAAAREYPRQRPA